MATVVVYGASDDLVEVDGDLGDEFIPANDEEPSYLAFSDGTILSIEYNSEGIWRIAPIVRGEAEYTIKQATGPDDVYTDEVTLVGDIQWVVFGTAYAKAKV